MPPRSMPRSAPRWRRRKTGTRRAVNSAPPCSSAPRSLFEEHTAALTARCVREAGKTLPDAIGEVREAVDFLRYYAVRARRDFSHEATLPGPTGERNLLRLRGKGVFGCISPWNFPLAIFTGQVAAALAAGNTVVAKPAEQTPLTAAYATALMLQAGVPPAALQFVPGEGADVGAALTRDPRLAGVVFTGSTDTARIIERSMAGATRRHRYADRRNRRSQRDAGRQLGARRTTGARRGAVRFQQRGTALLGAARVAGAGRNRRARADAAGRMHG